MASDTLQGWKDFLDDYHPSDSVNVYIVALRNLVLRAENAENTVYALEQYIQNCEGYGDEPDIDDLKRVLDYNNPKNYAPKVIAVSTEFIE